MLIHRCTRQVVHYGGTAPCAQGGPGQAGRPRRRRRLYIVQGCVSKAWRWALWSWVTLPIAGASVFTSLPLVSLR